MSDRLSFVSILMVVWALIDFLLISERFKKKLEEEDRRVIADMTVVYKDMTVVYKDMTVVYKDVPV